MNWLSSNSRSAQELAVQEPNVRIHAPDSPARNSRLTLIRVASADRRPVDPPPVVELKIYEEGETRQDITFSYHANFFLYITLENARAIAQGRMPNSQTTIPVLTGTPVAGMAYLDRPAPAGYFIFPDLSVRHEGKYRLSFNLFEETKDAKDADAESGPGSQDGVKTVASRNGANAISPQSHIHFRLEVKSEPFMVYSAKKFPGLKESTVISRIVSEQGCRVRIRRDVRMRRRDPKAPGLYDEYEDENVYARSDRFITPESYKPQIPERPRSIGNGTNDAVVPYHMDQHRQSMADFYNQGNFQTHHPAPNYPAHHAAPQPPNVSAGLGSHLAFGNPPGPSFAQANFQPPINQPSTALPGYQPPTALPGSNDYHQYSAPRNLDPYPSIEPQHPAPTNYYSLMTPSSQLAAFNPPRTGKRRHDTVFDTGHIDEPLRGGMRPNLVGLGQDVPQIEAEDGSLEDIDPRASIKLLQYRRADGRQQVRKCPSPVSE